MLVAALGVLVVLIAGSVVILVRHMAPPPDKPFTLIGTVEFRDVFASPTVGQPCTGSGDFTDLFAGALVLVYDAAGRTAGTAVLGDGLTVDIGPPAPICLFDFAVTDIPGGIGPYTARVASRPLTVFVFTRDTAARGLLRLTFAN